MYFYRGVAGLGGLLGGLPPATIDVSRCWPQLIEQSRKNAEMINQVITRSNDPRVAELKQRFEATMRANIDANSCPFVEGNGRVVEESNAVLKLARELDAGWDGIQYKCVSDQPQDRDKDHYYHCCPGQGWVKAKYESKEPCGKKGTGLNVCGPLPEGTTQYMVKCCPNMKEWVDINMDCRQAALQSGRAVANMPETILAPELVRPDTVDPRKFLVMGGLFLVITFITIIIKRKLG